jgi:hypothetical protein
MTKNEIKNLALETGMHANYCGNPAEGDPQWDFNPVLVRMQKNLIENHKKKMQANPKKINLKVKLAKYEYWLAKNIEKAKQFIESDLVKSLKHEASIV